MKTIKTHLISYGFILFIGLAGQNGWAIDSATRDTLIEKFSRIHAGLSEDDPSRTAVTLRLADLLAERARLDAMQDLDSGCLECTAGLEDRKRALQLYEEALSKVPDRQKGRVLTQIGHLFQLLGQSEKAIARYQKILHDQPDEAIKAEAQLSLAEIYFKRSQFNKAADFYQKILKNSAAESKGLAAYRLAWCEFNQSRVNKAIVGLVEMLRTPELLNRQARSDEVSIDQQFQEEVSRDLATFFAKKPANLDDIEQVYKLSPKSTRRQNISYLATELERLGSKTAALKAWEFVAGKLDVAEEKLEANIRMSQLYFDLDQRGEWIRQYKKALRIHSSLPSCESALCLELKSRLRKFITDWHRKEKKNPSEELFETYQAYMKVFEEDLDMQVWSAEVAEKLQKPQVATEIFNEVVQALKSMSDIDFSQRKISQKGKVERSALIETLLLKPIEIAEKAQNYDLRVAAYANYIKHSENQKEILAVRYQRAHLEYEKENFEQASQLLKDVALSKDAEDINLMIQAADLSLDALALLKKDKTLEDWASVYAERFPSKAAEYLKLARQSVLNQTEKFAADNSDDQAWVALSRMNIEEASPKERLLYHKNRLILAEKLRKLSEARESVEALLKIEVLDDKTRQFALAKKAWLAELVLDFSTALSVTSQLKIEKPEQRWFRLALLSDLAGEDASNYYQKYLKISKDESQKQAIATKLVKTSKQPQKTLDEYKQILIKNPANYSRLQLDIFTSRRTNEKNFKERLNQEVFVKTAAGQVMISQWLLDEHEALKEKLISHILDSSGQVKLSRSIKTRFRYIEEVENQLERAINLKNTVGQILALTLLQKESARFYEDLLSLPMPEGLNPEQQQQYLQILTQQAAPHQLKAQDVAKKLEEIWSDPKVVADLQSAYAEEDEAVRELLAREIKSLAEVAPEKSAQVLSASLDQPLKQEAQPSFAVVENVRSQVRSNPFDASRVRELIRLERQLGRSEMVSYLEARLNQMKEGDK